MVFRKIIATYRQKGFRRANKRIYDRLKFALIKTRYFNRRYIRKDVKDFEMYLMKDDIGLSMRLALEGERERDHTNEIRDNIDKGNVVLDIGSNIGYFALNESLEAGEEGLVYALEPVDKNYELLLKNLKLNDVKNVKTYNIGISDSVEEKEIIISNRSNHATFEESEKLSQMGKETVKVTTLDRFLEDKLTPDVIRMDVEGHEYNILMDQEIFDEDIDIFMEFHVDIMGEEKARELLNFLENKGYDVGDCSTKRKSKVHFTKR